MKTLLTYHIDEEACINCGSCRRFCPVDTIPYAHLQHQIDMTGCIGCTICYAVCPVDAVKVTAQTPEGLSKLLDQGTMERVRSQAWSKGPFYQQQRRQQGRVPHPKTARNAGSA